MKKIVLGVALIVALAAVGMVWMSRGSVEAGGSGSRFSGVVEI